MTFAESLERGREGERRVANILRERGWHIVPSYDFSGSDGDKAPKMYGPRRSFVIPDLDASRDGLRIWVEVKTKSRAVLWRKSGELRHGVETRLIEHYRQVERITGCDVWLVICEEDTREVLCASLRCIVANAIRGTNWASRMTMFPRSILRSLGHTV